MATQVLLLPLLNAADVAYNVVTLDHICAGRLDLGIGLASHLKEVELGGVTHQDRVPKFVETLEVMQRFWTGVIVFSNSQTVTVAGSGASLLFPSNKSGEARKLALQIAPWQMDPIYTKKLVNPDVINFSTGQVSDYLRGGASAVVYGSGALHMPLL